jgi:peptide/nickel transport system ATP-binding protein
MSSESEPVVSLDDVTIQFDSEQLFGLAGSESVRAVDDLSFKIHENEVVALVGESGCGKTTLGKTAIGLHRPTEGTVNYRGQDVWATRDGEGLLARLKGDGRDGEHEFSDIRQSLQIIQQDPEESLDSNSTVESILTEPLRRWEPDMSKADRRARVYGFLEHVGLTPADDFAHRFPHQLSGGEQQRLALIRALLMNPDLILADEAISALDVSLRINMMDLMLELQDQINTSYLFITHDISNGRYITKRSNGRIGIMYLGNLVEIGPVDEIIENPQHPYTKALLWATPDLSSGERAGSTHGIEDAPLRDIDVPDAAQPPSGCPFHTRCPEAREVCTREKPTPTSTATDKTQAHEAACFRAVEDHAYWDSPEIEDDANEKSTEQD